MLNPQILKKVNEWKETKIPSYLEEELLKMNEEELNDAFYKDLEFGTGGMRGIIGPGTNRMNIYTLRKANYGYACFLKDTGKKDLSVVIAYDCRHMSLDFAKESARVLAYLGIKCYLFPRITPTPLLSFSVRYLKATGGIVVTASHNPPKYNGYKIYDSDGCQLVPDLANIVINYVEKAPDPLYMEMPTFEEFEEKKMIMWLNDDVDRAYLEKVKSISVKDVNKENFKVVFTPLHGTSQFLGPILLTEMGYSFVTVKEQMVADPNFSTLVLPNPEDKRAFDLAIKYAKENDADICIATDPDADRVGLAVRDNDGNYVLLTGNQTGALLINYLAQNRKVDKQGVIFNTIVTNPLGVIIGKKYNLEYFSTLTGFKFIGEQAKLLENSKDKMFYFGYEESYGYVIKDFVRDKDSLQALLMCSEMACFYKNQGLTLLDVLEGLYKEFGYYLDALENFVLEGESGALRINRILDRFRKEALPEGVFEIESKEDYLLHEKINYLTNEKSMLTLPTSNVIKYNLKDGGFFVLRPSGTEPKMKLYISEVGKTREIALEKIKYIKENVIKIIEEVK